MTPFIDLTDAQKEQTRIYWMLHLEGPLTMPDLRARTNWTTHRLNQRLYQLRTDGCVRLIERGRHTRLNSTGANQCGRWEALTAVDVPTNIVDALMVAV